MILRTDLKNKYLYILIPCLLIFTSLFSQEVIAVNDSIIHADPDNSENRDIIDVIHHLFKKHEHPHGTDPFVKKENYHFSFVPAIGYTLQTGFAGILSANLAYYNSLDKDQKISSITTSFTYSQYSQSILPLIADIWTKHNTYNLISDNRFIQYPSSIYGLGGRIDPNKGHTINFSGIKLHETVLKSLSKDLYGGFGIYYDQFWNIQVIDSLTRRINSVINRELGTSERAVGITMKLLYDNRLNQINADNGWYINGVYRNNQEFMGSDDSWQSLMIDIRKYFHFPARSKNTLAFWSLDWITLAGKPPYLLMPSTGWDDQYNSGRGYIQGRFRGNNMYYLESEYRYKISRNGLFGGVVFANVQKYSSELSSEYKTLQPGYGLGFRLKLNKHSGTNLCVDYGFGANGSQGVFVNLGEVF